MDISKFNTVANYNIEQSIPQQCQEGIWVGRVWLDSYTATNSVAGPRIVSAKNGHIVDLSAHYSTMADLFNDENRNSTINQCDGPIIGTINQILKNSQFNHPVQGATLLAPNDIQSVKACGVTFIRSLLERVIEEQARGDATKAASIRDKITQVIGSNLANIKPGTEQTELLKQSLIQQGIWSQYLEVGIGPDAEVFTKAQALSSVSSGSQIGVLSTSHWNNPEPEVVMAVTPSGEIIGATLGNDVNLRDYEGRSALLLGKAKDNNGASSIGPFIRLFDETFSLDDVKQCAVTLTITGEDEFVTTGENLMSEISRSPEELVSQTLNRNHQYPDGMMLYLGTMFAPTEDRDNAGEGFTHKVGDRVEISTPKLGSLVNWVNHCHDIPVWDYGIHQFISYLTATNQEG